MPYKYSQNCEPSKFHFPEVSGFHFHEGSCAAVIPGSQLEQVHHQYWNCGVIIFISVDGSPWARCNQYPYIDIRVGCTLLASDGRRGCIGTASLRGPVVIFIGLLRGPITISVNKSTNSVGTASIIGSHRGPIIIVNKSTNSIENSSLRGRGTLKSR